MSKTFLNTRSLGAARGKVEGRWRHEGRLPLVLEQGVSRKNCRVWGGQQVANVESIETSESRCDSSNLATSSVFFLSPTPFHDPANFSVSLAAPLSSSLFSTGRRTRILHFAPSLSVLFAFNSRYLLGSPLVSSASVLFNFRLFYLLLLAAFLPPAPTLFLRSLRISNVLGELLVIEFFCIEWLPLAVNPQAHPGDVGSALSTVHRLPHDCATVIRFVGYRLLSLTRRFSTDSLRKRQALSLGT